MNVTNFSKRLREILASRNMTQASLVELCQPHARRIGVTITKGDISHYCQGLYEPKAEKLSCIASALDVSEGFLLGYTDGKEISLDVDEQMLITAWRLAPASVRDTIAFMLRDYGMRQTALEAREEVC